MSSSQTDMITFDRFERVEQSLTEDPRWEHDRSDHTCFVGFVVHHENDLIFDELILLVIDGPHSIAHVEIFDATLFTIDETDQIFAIEARWS